MRAEQPTPLPSHRLEESAVLETIRVLDQNSKQSRSAFARKVKAWLDKNYELVGHAYNLPAYKQDELYARCNDQDVSIRAAIDRICKGDGVGRENLQILTQYIKSHAAAEAIYTEIFERLELEENNKNAFLLGTLFDGTTRDVPDVIESMRGDYVLYRPYYFDPQYQVMRCHLQIGSASSPFTTRLDYFYEARDYGGKEFDYPLEGLAVPLPNLNRAIINLLDKNKKKFSTGNQMLYVENIEMFERQATILSGVALSALGPSPATAWPFIAARADYHGNFRPDIIPFTDKAIKSYIHTKISRGTIAWDARFA